MRTITIGVESSREHASRIGLHPTAKGEKLTMLAMQMPDTRTLTFAVGDGTFKPANTLFADLSSESGGEYLVLGQEALSKGDDVPTR